MQDKGVTNQAAFSDDTSYSTVAGWGNWNVLWKKTGGGKCPAYLIIFSLHQVPFSLATPVLPASGVPSRDFCGVGWQGMRVGFRVGSKLLHFVLICLWLEHWTSEASWYRPEALGRISHCGLRAGLELLLLSSCFENVSVGGKSRNHNLSFGPVHEQVWLQRDALNIWVVLLKSQAQKERC